MACARALADPHEVVVYLVEGYALEVEDRVVVGVEVARVGLVAREVEVEPEQFGESQVAQEPEQGERRRGQDTSCQGLEVESGALSHEARAREIEPRLELRALVTGEWLVQVG